MFPGFLRRYKTEYKGTTAIEFSLLAVPFSLFIIGIIELSLVFAGGFLLQGAVNDAVRLIRTGQVQEASGDPQDMFRQALCDHAVVLLNCNNIQFNVQTLANFSDPGVPAGFDDEGNLEDQSFNVGGVREVVMIQVAYLYPMMTPGVGQLFADYPGSKKLLTTIVVIETEPYDFESQV